MHVSTHTGLHTDTNKTTELSIVDSYQPTQISGGPKGSRSTFLGAGRDTFGFFFGSCADLRFSLIAQSSGSIIKFLDFL